MIHLDPNSELGRKVSRLRAEETKRLWRKFTNIFRKKSQPTMEKTNETI